MKLKNETYDQIKKVVALVLPPLITFIATCGTILNWEYTEVVTQLLAALNTFLGVVMMYSSKNYNNQIHNES